MGNIQYRPPFTAVNSVAPNRSLGVQYTNTTGKMMLLVVTCTCTTGATAGSQNYFSVTVDSNLMGRAGHLAGAANSSMYGSVTLIVNPNVTYQVDATMTGTGNVTKLYWIEVY